MKSGTWFKIFIYVSLAFLAITLYKSGGFVWPKLSNYYSLVLAIIIIIISFLVDAKSWQTALKSNNISASYSLSFVSAGLSVFAKYIPGKILVILGRAMYISRKKEIPLKSCSETSLHLQLISIWSVMLLGFIPMLSIDSLKSYVIFWVLAFACLSVWLFFKKGRIYFTKLFKRLFKKEINISTWSFKQNAASICWLLLYWTLLGSGFYYLAASLGIDLEGIRGIYIFPFATVLGILAIIFPGGLGVREGILAFCLISLGIADIEANSAAIFSRLWYLGAEVIIFLLALFLNRGSNLSHY